LAINVRREDAKAADQNFANEASEVRLQLSPLWALLPIEQDAACVLTGTAAVVISPRA
jgi:hypothetical protein